MLAIVTVVSPLSYRTARCSSLAVLIESLGCGTLPWRKEMEKGEGHGVRLVCDAVDSDIVMTMDTVSFSFGKPLWGGAGGGYL